MIIWVNGPFGAGKSSTATHIVEQADGLRIFDPEWVGLMLTANLTDRRVPDFQEWAAWRSLVPVVADQIIATTGQGLVIVQSVLNFEYWVELVDGFERQGERLFHVVLEAEEVALRDRIVHDAVESDAKEWRLEHLAVYKQARTWMTREADLVLDTTDLDPEGAAASILASVVRRN